MRHVNKITATAGIALISLGILTGCSAKESDSTPSSTAAASSSAASESATPSESPASGGHDRALIGDILKPGEKTTGAASIPFTNADKKTAVFEHKLLSVEKAPQADVDNIVSQVPKAAGLDIYYLNIESHYVSGDNLAFSAFYTSFDPVDASGNPTQTLSLIGWDNCESNSIPKDATNPSVTIKNCVAAVAAPGGNAPAGVAWDQSDTPYDSYDGSPALFFLP